MKTHRFLLRAAALLAVAITQFAVASRAIAQTTVSLSVIDSVVAETWPGQSPNPGNIRVTRTGSTASPLTVWVKLDGKPCAARIISSALPSALTSSSRRAAPN